MVLWFGLKERVKDLEENMKELIEANENMIKQLESIDEKLNNLVAPKSNVDEYVKPTKKLTEADKYLARLEHMKYMTIRRKIESLEKLLGVVPDEAVENVGEGISKDLISQVLDFVKQNPDVISKVQEYLKQWKTAPTPQQKEEAKESIYDILKPIPLKVQTQTQQQSSQQQ